MPALTSLIEYGLYVEDVNRAADWYRRVFCFPTLLEESDRLRALQTGPGTVLLLFRKEASLEGVQMPAGFIPSHDGDGPVHIAFRMPADETESWSEHLSSEGVAIESTIQWPEGGTSFYFRDPDRHLLELITPRQWKFAPWPAPSAGV